MEHIPTPIENNCILMRKQLHQAYCSLRDTVDRFQKEINIALMNYQSLDPSDQYTVQEMMKKVSAANAALYALGTVAF